VLGLDTNVLVRFLVRDDERQFAAACALINPEGGDAEEILVSLMALLETEWVLRSRYGMPKEEIIETISALLGTEGMWLEDESAVEEAIFNWKNGTANFADCLIGSRNRRLGCRATATFDAKAARLPGFVVL
jgi:predicted nucleic-acid-binding protein